MVLIFGGYFCVINWRARAEAKNKAQIEAELVEYEREMKARQGNVRGFDDSVTYVRDKKTGKSKTRTKRVIGGIDYLSEIDNFGNIIGMKKKEVSLR